MSREPSIRVSEKHGVNPSMGVCFWCGEDDGTVLLVGKMKDDAEAPRRMCVGLEPCKTCEEKMAAGVVCAEALHNTGEEPQPTGRWVLLTHEAVDRLFNVEVKDKCWMDPETFNALFSEEMEALG